MNSILPNAATVALMVKGKVGVSLRNFMIRDIMGVVNSFNCDAHMQMLQKSVPEVCYLSL
jgi:hypothetical protein